MILNFALFVNFLLSSESCPKINTVNNLNLTEYISHNWYIQMQQETYYLPKDFNYCVRANYKNSNKKIPFYKGEVLDVYNYANKGKINSYNVNFQNTILCARIPDNKIQSKLIVAPCFLPNFLGGDYWILDAGPESNNYEYAIVIGGQPDVRYTDGCTTKTNKVNNAGLWLFTKEPTPPNSIIDYMLNKLKILGISKSQLNNVTQKGCLYKN